MVIHTEMSFTMLTLIPMQNQWDIEKEFADGESYP